MIEKELLKIIDFAIEREKEAVEFYQNLQKMADFSSKREMLHEFELMEMGHIKTLENLKKEEIEDIKLENIQDLHLSDYLVSAPASEDMSYQNILIIAIKKEEKAYRLYTDLADRQRDEKIKKLFQKLAREEAKHKQHFEKIYDDEILDNN